MGSTYVRLVNDFFHDLAAGFFPGAAVGAVVIKSHASSGGGVALTPQAVGIIWMLLVLGLFVSVGTGIFRLRYHSAPVKPELVKARNEAAFTKHIAFIIVLAAAGIIFGTVVA